MASNQDHASVRKSTTFGGDVARVVSGSTGAKIASIAALPLLTRFYAPDAFGLAAVFIALFGVLNIVSSLRYEPAIVVARRQSEAANLLGLSVLIAGIFTLGLVGLLWLTGDSFLPWLNAPGLKPYLWLLPPAILVAAIFSALNYWNTRTKNFGRLAAAQVTASVSIAGSQLGAGVAGFTSAGGLITGTIAGSFVSAAVLARQIWRADGNHLKRQIRGRRLAAVLRKYKKFPVVNTWSALANVVSAQLPIFLFAAFFSPTIVGLYALAHRTLSMPLGLIAASVGRVFYQRAAQARTDGDLPNVIVGVFAQLTRIAAIPFMFVICVGQELFAVAFGPEWREAGLYAQILALAVATQFVTSPISVLSLVLNKLEHEFVFSISLLIAKAGSIVIGALTGSVLLALGLYAGSGLFLYGAYCAWLMRLGGARIDAVIAASKGVMAAAPIVGAVFAARWYWQLDDTAMLLIGITSTAVYGGIVVSREEVRIWLLRMRERRVAT